MGHGSLYARHVSTDQLTIDQLAQRTGMTVRNLRAHQSRGLLPPPDVRGRTGYYGQEHVDRVELIKELQADGFNLDLIGRMLANSGGSSGQVLRFTRRLREPFGDEEPEMVTAQELAEQWGTDDASLLAKAQELGVLQPVGNGSFEVMSPRLARAGAELASLGIPPKRALEVVARLRRHADSAAKTFADLFLDSVWKPFDRAGRPEDRWPEVADALERLRPLASDSFLAVFQMAMNDVVEKEFGRELQRSPRDGRRR